MSDQHVPDLPAAQVLSESDKLRAAVWSLFLLAKDQEKPDHTACAKYAEILFKGLPKSSRRDPEIDQFLQSMNMKDATIWLSPDHQPDKPA